MKAGFLALLLTGFALPAVAQGPVLPPMPAASPAVTSPAALASARKLLTLMQVDRTVSTMFDSLVPLMASSTVGALETQPATSDLMKSLESAPGGRDKLLRIFSEEFSAGFKQATPLLLERTAQEYATSFNESELNEMVNFYSSGVGEKMVTLLPQLQQKMTIFGQQTGREVGSKAGESAMKRAFDELKPAKKEIQS